MSEVMEVGLEKLSGFNSVTFLSMGIFFLQNTQESHAPNL